MPKTKAAAPKTAAQRTRMTRDEFMQKELPHLTEIVSFCGNLPVSLYADSTVVKSPEAVFRGLCFSRNRLLSEEYLLNFRRSEADMGMLIGVNNYRLPMVLGALALRKLKEDPRGLLELPPAKKVNVPLGPVMRSRRSVRNYTGQPLAKTDLATILYYAQGVTWKLTLRDMPATAVLGANNELELRAVGSGGGLYPVDLYLLGLNLEGLEKGAYHYLPQQHALRLVKKLPADFHHSQAGQFGEIQVDKANLLVVYVYRLFDNSRKYGDSGLAYALLEAGGIAQNLHLASTALGLGPCDVGGYAKHQLEALLGLDGLSQHVIHLTVLGAPAPGGATEQKIG